MKQYRGGGSHWQSLHRSALEANADTAAGAATAQHHGRVEPVDTSSKLSDKPEHLNTVEWTANATDV